MGLFPDRANISGKLEFCSTRARGLRNPPVVSLKHHLFMLHASPSPNAALPQTVIHTQSICSGRRPSKGGTGNDSTVAEAWKEYVFPVGEDVSALLRHSRPHSTGGSQCEEHSEVWQMHAKNWCKFRRNSLSFRNASKPCGIA